MTKTDAAISEKQDDRGRVTISRTLTGRALMNSLSIDQQDQANQQTFRVKHKGEYATIVVALGNQNLMVLAKSSFGTFGAFWARTGPNPEKFMCGMDKSYAMKNLANFNHTEPDLDGMRRSIKEQIIEARIDGRATKEEAREAWDDLTYESEEHVSVELNAYDLVRACYDHIHFTEIFGDTESLPANKRMNSQCEGFWETIWVPFTDWYTSNRLSENQ